MCGYGVLTYSEAGSKRGYYDYYGTFFKDKFHGVGKQFWPEFVYVGEYTEGRRNGRATHYMKDGQTLNVTYQSGQEISSTKIENSKDAWYGNDLQDFSDFNNESN